MVSAVHVANYFLSKADDDAGDVISNLKLQKLLYYAQGFTLAIMGAPLFPEKIEAWTHGPVVPDVYHYFKAHGNAGLPIPAEVPEMPDDYATILDEVYSVYAQFSAWKLRNMTHDESPWKDTIKSQEITNASLFDFFSTQLV